jgi:XapX domain-containing protein
MVSPGDLPHWPLSDELGPERRTHMIAIAVGLLFAFAIGAFCRWFDIPSPSPPRMIGALLVVAMTVGFLIADRLLAG